MQELVQWCSEKETQLTPAPSLQHSDFLGKDLSSVRTFTNRHDVLEAEINSKETEIALAEAKCAAFASKGIYMIYIYDIYVYIKKLYIYIYFYI